MSSQGWQAPLAEYAPLRVGILEDDRFAKAGIVAELEEAGIEVIVETSDPETMQDLMALHRPDVAIIDLHLGREDHDYRGLEAISRIKEIAPGIKCIVVTAFPTISNFKAAILAGAEGYIAKENSVQNDLTMGEVVRRVMKGERCYDGELVAQVVAQPGAYPAPAIRNPLTVRGQEILRLVDRTNEEIAATLNIAESTVKAHLKSSFEKLSLAAGRKVYNRREAAEVARVMGYI